MTAGSATDAAPGPLVSAVPLLLHHVRRHARLTGAVLLLVICGGVAAVAAQYGLKILVDVMTEGTGPSVAASGGTARDAAVVLRALGVFLGLLAVETVCWRLAGFVGARAVVVIGEEIRLDLFTRVSARAWTFFNGQASGALAGRITAAASNATAALRTVIWNVIPPTTDLIGSVIVLSLVDWRIGGALLVAAVPITLLFHNLGKRGFPLHAAFHGQAASVAGVLADVLGNMDVVRAYGAQRWERERLRTQMQTENRAHAASWFFLERIRCWHDLLFWLLNSAVLAVAIVQWSRGAITSGGVVVATTLTLRILAGSREMALSLLGLSQQLGAVAEAVDVFGALPVCAGGPEVTGRTQLRPRQGAIALHDIRHATGPHCTVFAGLDLDIPPGQRVGIVGPSGAGKSTLLRIIQGVQQPSAGRVTVDGQVLAECSSESLADAFSVVTQEVGLLQRSVAENLRYGRPDAAWPEVLAVSRALGCDRLIAGLPFGYETIVGERGARLSGGQRQRIAVARALLREAPILLLDEATSALDTGAEREVQRAILQLASGRTVIAVAHRLSTIMDFDRVIVVQHGRIVEDGAPDALRHGDGYFGRTWRAQQGAAVPLDAASWAQHAHAE